MYIYIYIYMYSYSLYFHTIYTHFSKTKKGKPLSEEARHISVSFIGTDGAVLEVCIFVLCVCVCVCVHNTLSHIYRLINIIKESKEGFVLDDSKDCSSSSWQDIYIFVYVCVYICLCVYMCMCIYIYIYIYIYICMYVYPHICIRVRTYTFMRMHVYI